MAEALRLYDLSDSPFCLKVRIVLQLKGVSYAVVPLTIGRRRELGRLNPLRKVPVLVTERGPLAESSDIVRYLEERHPKPALLPKDKEARAFCGMLDDWAGASLYWTIGAFKFLNPENAARARRRSAEMASGLFPAFLVGRAVHHLIKRRYRAWGYTEAALPHLIDKMKTSLQHLDGLLGEKPFLLGRYVTLADLSVYAQLEWMSGYTEGRLIDAFPGVKAWMERLGAIPEIAKAAAGPPRNRDHRSPNDH